jgi:hypothetical protein
MATSNDANKVATDFEKIINEGKYCADTGLIQT